MANGLANRTDFTWLLTGTPAPNTYQNLWAQIYLLDQGKRLGKSFTAFTDRWYYKIRVNAKKYVG
jgi:SNF2 family DNA or RNA helicase